MKSNIFKKIVAGVATLAMASQMAFVMPAFAVELGSGTEAEPYVNVNFSGDTAGAKVYGYTSAQANLTDVTSEDGWITYYVGSNNRYAGSISVQNDSDAYGNYAYVSADQFADADSGNKRAPSFKINAVPALSSITTGNEMAYEFDFKTSLTTGVIYLNDDTDKPDGDFIRLNLSKLPVDTWLSAVVTIDSANKMCVAEIFNGEESVDVQTNTYTTDGNPTRLRFLGGAGNLCKYSIDNLKIYQKKKETQYKVSFSVDGTETNQLIKDGEKITEVPETEVKGKVFDGWYQDDETTLLSNEEVMQLEITADTTFTAQYHNDSAYIQTIKSLSFIKKKSDAINQPEEGITDSYDYEVQVISDINNDISDDCTYEWTIVGTENDDNYANLIVSPENGKTAQLNVKNGVGNYYGYIQVVATYNPENSENEEDNTTETVQTPYAILGSTASTNIIPAAGYPEDMNAFADSVVGYAGLANGINDRDLVLNNWSIYGSNGSRTLTLKKEESTGYKYLEFASNNGGGSTVGVYQWTAQTKQYTIDTVVKLANGAYIGVYSNTPNNTGVAAEFEVGISGGSLTAGTGSVAGFSNDEWYRLVISCDPIVKKYYVKAYDMAGKLKGEISDIDCGGNATMKYLCISGAYPSALKSMVAYNPTIKKMVVNSDSDTVKVPEAGEAATSVSLSANCEDKDGNKILGDITWSLEEDYANVTITPNGQNATLTINSGASGDIVVNAVRDGVTSSKTITLTTSSNVVSIKGTSSLTIPFVGEKAVVGTYIAQTLDKDSKPIENDKITYSFIAKDGSTPLESLPNGVTFDSEAAKLTVSAGASPAIIYLKATNADGLSNKLRINIHGMSFGFGSNDPEEGYTQVTAESQYTDVLGYGFEKTTGITDAESNVAGTADYKFKVKIPNGNYVVNVETTSATMKSEVLDAATEVGTVTGVTKSGDKFKVAVCDGVLDLTFLAGTNVSSLVISQDTVKSQLAKPAIYAIGDSTTNNTGHPSGYNPETSKDHRTYASWGSCVNREGAELPETFSGFTNNGMAGRNSISYYNEGRLENVLLSVAPGDYVTVNMGINSLADSTEPYEDVMENYYVQGIIQRGGIPVILTHTPQGPVGKGEGNYSNGVFNCSRSGDGRVNFLKSLAEKYDLNLIDVGKWGNDYFNSLTLDDLGLANTQNSKEESYVAPTTVIEVVRSWYPDHNHYTEELGKVFANYILSEIEKISNEIKVTFNQSQYAENNVIFSATTEGEGSATFDAYVAEYDASNNLIGLAKSPITITDTVNSVNVGYTRKSEDSTLKAFVWDNMKPCMDNTLVNITE